jgi:hypothetical protein
MGRDMLDKYTGKHEFKHIYQVITLRYTVLIDPYTLPILCWDLRHTLCTHRQGPFVE